MYRSVHCSSPWIATLRGHLRRQRYCARIAQIYEFAARCFLRELERKGKGVETILPADFERYQAGLKRLRDRRSLPVESKRPHVAAIKMLMRLVRGGDWPPECEPATPDEVAIMESSSATTLG